MLTGNAGGGGGGQELYCNNDDGQINCIDNTCICQVALLFLFHL